MLKWLKQNLGLSFGPLPPSDERILALQRETQSLRLELEEYGRRLALLADDLERQQTGESARIAQAVQAQLEKLLTDIAGPITQLLTQAHLLEVESRPVQAKDVLAVAKRLVRALEDEGLQFEGSVGETASFDPNRHEPLGGNDALAPGQPVVVRFVGVAYRGKMIRKAGIEKRG